MPLSEEERRELVREIAESIIPNITETITPEINKTVTGAVVKLRKEMQNDIQQMSGKIQTTEQLEQIVQSQLSGVIESVTKLSDSSHDGTSEDKSEATSDIAENEQFKKLVDQIEALKTQNQTLQTNFTESQKLAEEKERLLSRTQQEASFRQAVQGRVVDPEQFLMAAERFGGVKIKNGDFVIEKNDEFGTPQYYKVLEKNSAGRDLIDEMLSQERFKIHAIPRPGSGGGSSPGQTAPNGAVQSQPVFFRHGEHLDRAKITEAAKTHGIDTLIEDLLKTSES